MAEVIVDSVYLMGELVDPKGMSVKGAQLHPLPGYALSLPELTNNDIKDGSSSKNEAPIYYSDASGQLQALNSQLLMPEDIEKLESGALVPSSAVLSAKSVDKWQPIFIPPHLLPLAMLSEDTEWTKSLHSLVRSSQKDYKKLSKGKIKLSSVPALHIAKDTLVKKKSIRLFMPPEIAKHYTQAADDSATKLLKVAGVSGSNLSDETYETLYEKIYSGKFQHDFYYLRVPQVWTINLVFSADYFQGARVTMSGYPTSIKIQGDQGVVGDVPLSWVREVTYNDFAGKTEDGKNKSEPKKQYVATFWIVGGALTNEIELKKLCRFDIDLLGAIDKRGSEDPSIVEKIAQLGIPDNRYSISEQVLHLPIQSMVGRSVIVSGDPVSVEEALFQHSPQSFDHLVKWTKNQAYTQKHEAKKDAKPDLDIMKSLGTYKGVIQAGADGLVNGASMSFVSKAFSAGLSLDKGKGEDDSLLEFLKIAAGVNGSADGFLSFANDLRPSVKNNPYIASFADLAKEFKWADKAGDGIKSIVNRTDANLIRVPESLQQFWHTLDDKVRSPLLPVVKGTAYLLDKPFGFAQLVSSAFEATDKIEKADQAFTKYVVKASQYSQATQSISYELVNTTEELRKEYLKQEASEKAKLKKAFESYKGNNKVLLNGKPIAQSSVSDQGEGKPIILTMLFDFDSASYDIKEQELSLVNQVASYLMNTKAQMELRIYGYTCDIGKKAYNLELSERRAQTLRETLLTCLGNEKEVWQDRILAIGCGEKQSKSDDRKACRRAELEFHIHSAFDYPVSRSWVLALEKARQTTFATALSSDDALRSTAGQAFDIVLGVSASVLGPCAAVAYGFYWAGDMMLSVFDALNKQFNDEQWKRIDAMKRLSEFDVIGQSLMLKDAQSFEKLSVMAKAYIKRSLALNGLMRLLLLEKYVSSINTSSAFDAYWGIPNSFLSSKKVDFNIKGYIETFILSDDWDIGNSSCWNMAFHLDEIWLETNDIFMMSGAESLKSFVEMGNYIIYKTKQSDSGEVALSQAQKYQKYCPVHTIADSSLKTLRDMFNAPVLKDLSDDIYTYHHISARANGTEEWLPLGEYLDRNDGKVTPLEEVRILVLIDVSHKELDTIKKEGQLNLIPISAKPIRVNRLFDDIGGQTVEYVRKLDFALLTKSEREGIEKKGLIKGTETTGLYGVIITPTYYFGRSVLAGTKPIAEYDDSALKAVFGKPEENDSAEYSMRYKYEIEVLGSSNSSKVLTYSKPYKVMDGDKWVKKWVDNANIFDLVLRPEHSYFYEKTFLARKGKKEIEYPEVISNPKVNLFIKVDGMGKLSDSNDVPVLEEVGYTASNVDSSVWSNDAELLILVSSKDVNSKKLLSTQKFEENRLPVDITLKANDRKDKYSIKLPKATHIHRIAKLAVDLEKKEINFEADKVPQDLQEIASFVRSNIKKLAGDLVVEDGFLTPKPVDTELYAVRVPLNYINVLGTKVNGLRPFVSDTVNNPKVWVDVDGKAGMGLNESSNAIFMPKLPVKEASFFERMRLTSISKPWLSLDKTDFDNALKYRELKSSYDNAVNEVDKNILKHDSSRLTNWIKAEPKIQDYEMATETPLSKEREKMLVDWVLRDYS